MNQSFRHFLMPRPAISFAMLLLVITCFFLAVLIPPMQSPDEHDHIERAYLLGKGVLVLDHPNGMPSGGLIDSGLLKYQKSYELVKKKLTSEDIETADNFRWSGERVYDLSPGTGYYFPIVYAPQAVGLVIGETLGLTINSSYRLARAFATVTTILLFLLAFRIYPVNALTLGFISMPMSLFQFSSAGLDGISTGLAVLSVALFMRIAGDRGSAARWKFYLLAIALTILLTSRAHLLPFMAISLAAFLYCRRRENFFLFVATTSLILVWTAIAIKTTVSVGALTASESTSSIVLSYLKQPWSFFEVFWKTVSDKNTLVFYIVSFLGILGWLDTQFTPAIYISLAVGLVIITLVTFSLRDLKQNWSQRLLIVAVAFSSILLIFFALLVTWTPHPASIILGVQGRYFLVPLIALAYSIAGSQNIHTGRRGVLSMSLCLCFFIFSAMSTFELLLSRYYTVPYQLKVEKVLYSFGGTDARDKKMVASEQLGERSPIRFKLQPVVHNNMKDLARVGVMIGTHMRKNAGLAELVLTTATGITYRQEFSMGALKDNQYKYFSVPVATYTAGEIRSISGGGISVWESHAVNGEALTCINYLYASNTMVAVAGCP